MKNMKQKIDVSLTRSMEREINLKLGRGGSARSSSSSRRCNWSMPARIPGFERNSLKALDRLLEANLITEDDHVAFSDAYRFLRTVNTASRWCRSQTTTFPPKPMSCAPWRDGAVFWAATGWSASGNLELGTAHVSAIYGNLFLSRDDRLQRDVSPEVLFLLDHKADADMVRDMLAERRFEDVERATTTCLLRDGRSGATLPSATADCWRRSRRCCCRNCWNRPIRIWP